MNLILEQQRRVQLGAKNTFAPKYFVDSVNGLDTNDGLTAETAWKTITKVNGRTYVAGDKIGFKRGQTFAGQLIVPSSGSVGNPIAIGSYGIGAYPIIAQASASSSLLISGKSNIKIQNLTIQEYSGNVGYRALMISGTVSNIEVEKCNLHSSGYGISIAAAINGATFKNISITGTTKQAIYFYGATNSNVSITGCSTGSGWFDIRNATNITCSNNVTNGIYMTASLGTLQANDNIIINSDQTGGAIYFNSNAFTNGVCSYNYIRGAVAGGVMLLATSGIYVSDSTVFESDEGFQAKSGSFNNTFENCFAINNTGDGFVTNTIAHDITFRYCRASGNGTKSSTSAGDGFTSHETDYNLKFIYCIADNNTCSGFALTMNSVGFIYGCTVFGNASNWTSVGGVDQIRGGMYLTAEINAITSTAWVVRNCIVANNYPFEVNKSIPPTLDYNCYFAIDAEKFGKIDVTTNIPWADYAANEPNSVYQNPQLTNLIPDTKIEIGSDLGVDYNAGLGIATTWGDGTVLPVIVTKQQTGTWQVGAYVK